MACRAGTSPQGDAAPRRVQVEAVGTTWTQARRRHAAPPARNSSGSGTRRKWWRVRNEKGIIPASAREAATLPFRKVGAVRAAPGYDYLRAGSFEARAAAMNSPACLARVITLPRSSSSKFLVYFRSPSPFS